MPKKNEQKAKEKALSRQLTDFLYEQYNLSSLPKYFFMNLQKIYKGEYSKNLRKPIPCEDLFDMWQKKMDYLNRQNEYNKEHGKELYGVQRVQYDLAILINKYDSYRAWKDKQTAIHEQEKSFKAQTSYTKAIKNQPKIATIQDDDITSIIDEI